MPTFPTPWVLTPLCTGSLISDTYDMDINSLSASTIYEYRAYAVISGVPYYGNVLTGCTEAVPAGIPTVCTASGAISITSDSMLLKFNKMCNNNGAPIAEYGALYTQNPTFGTLASLCYENVPSLVCKSSNFATIANDTQYLTPLTGLSENTITYYRAFARNAIGSGYGDVCTQQTANAKDVNLCLYGSTGTDGLASRFECHCIVTTPPMVSGECYCLCLGVPLYVAPALVWDGVSLTTSCSSYCVYCKGVSMLGFVMLQSCDLYQTSCSPDTISNVSIKMCYGDIIRIYQKAVTLSGEMGQGGTNSCACIKAVTSISGAGTFDIGTTCQSSCAYSG
jgi:hypothetical protein